MTKIIPDKDLEKYIQAIGWTPGQKAPVRKPVNEPNKTQPTSQSIVNIDDILKGNTFYSEEKKDDKYIGVAVALQEALDFIGTDGYVATMPELIAAKIKADKSHDFWQKWYAIHTEENIGVDKKGRFYTANEPVLVLVNGGGILTPDRIMKAYDGGLVNNSAKYEFTEFDNLLDGQLPDGSSIKLFSFEDIKKGVSNLPHRFGVVMPYSTAQGTESGYHNKKAFMENPLVIARAGGVKNLESYYKKAKNSDGNLGCWHPFNDRDASVPQGRVLFLYNINNGLNGIINLIDIGRFVGVAPEAHVARKL
ncbi:MAG: hypothetical protein KKA65_03075 [Nanoarchaeota archaeon]|nr:hypothetical protein [Nanoarchaeota archaeon]